MVIGFVNDKDITSILKLLPPEAYYYFCKASIPRALDENILAAEAEKYGLNGNTYPSVHEAFLAAKNNAGNDDLIFIGGSTFVVGEVL
jgi:dihydrofolate synthase/folylpolyglutamate synthase